MDMFALFPSREIALTVAGFSVHWYGIMYLLAFLLAYWLLPRLQKYRGLSLTSDQWSTIVSYVVVGVIVGGRLGYVLFYDPVFFLSNPLQIFAVWNGGMASHGGFAGVIAALYLVSRRLRVDFWKLADLAIVPAAIGLAFGRVGNFINQELYGTVTTLPWGMEFPGAEGLRHPTQLYAVFKNLTVASLCFMHLKRVQDAPHGRTAALFLVLYGIARFIVEHFREQTHAGFDLGIVSLTRGQALTIPLILTGIIVLILLKRRKA